MKFFSATSKTKRHINANDRSAIMTIAAAVVLLGAFFVINPINLTAFAAVDPVTVNFNSTEEGPAHPGLMLVENKNVTFDISNAGQVNFTVIPFFEGTMEICVDAQDPPVTVLNLTTANQTELVGTPLKGFLLYNETFVGMPGVYHCNVIFKYVNVTDSSDSQVIGNQTVWIDAIGSKGFWKNHPDATEVHLPILLGNQTLNATNMADPDTSFNVTSPEEATELFKKHKGKLTLNRLAGQLLAAKLNIWALNMTDNQPNEKVDCIAGNVTAADELLRDNDWSGVESDAAIDKSERRTVLTVHKFLDRFNNFGCSGDPPLDKNA